MAPKVVPGNPRYITYMQELIDRAEERGDKSVSTYKRGMRSLRECPITFTLPREAAKLEGIGPKTVEYFAKQERKYYAETGAEPPPLSPKKVAKKKKAPAADSDDGLGDLFGGGSKAPAKRKKTAAQRAANQSDEEYSSDDGKAANKPSPKKRKKSVKDYVPHTRSGAYGILLGLYQLSSFDSRELFHTREEIVREAAPFADQSYDTTSGSAGGGKTSGGASFAYSAWSGMKTLTEKALVMVDNRRPKRWALAPTGYALAESLVVTTNGMVKKHVPGEEPVGETEHNRYVGGSGSGSGGGGGSGSGKKASAGGSMKAAWAAVAEALGADDVAALRNMPEHEAKSIVTGMGFKWPGDAMDIDNPPVAAKKKPAHNMVNKVTADTVRSLGNPSSRQSLGNSTLDDDLSKEASGSGSGGYAAFSGKGHALGGGSGKSAKDIYANYKPPEAAPARQIGSSVFYYYYLDPNDIRVINREEAEMSNEEGHDRCLYRVEWRMGQDMHMTAVNAIKKERLNRPGEQPTMGGYIRERVANAKAPGFQTVSPKEPALSHADKVKALLGNAQVKPKADPRAMYNPPPRAAPAPAPKRALADQAVVLDSSSEEDDDDHVPAVVAGFSSKRKRDSSVPGGHGEASTSGGAVAGPSRSVSAVSVASSSGGDGSLSKYAPLPPDGVVNTHPLDPIFDHIASVNFKFTPFNPIVWRAGDFEVVLILDHREKETKKKVRDSTPDLVEQLKNMGVKAEVKALPVGDMIWVARRRDGMGKDVVMDTVIERKRLDDLTMSIKDGRYHEQKTRMKESGISCRGYIIETYDKKQQEKEYKKQIDTAKSQLQVTDGFFLFESANMPETLGWLRLRTNVMKEVFEAQDLYILPDSIVARDTYLALQQHLKKAEPERTYLTSYEMYNGINKKSDALPLERVWAGMVQCFNGISAEKAIPLVERWHTPRDFFEAVCERRVQAGREGEVVPAKGGKMAAKALEPQYFIARELAGLEAARSIKNAMSAKLYNFYSAKKAYAGASASNEDSD